MSPLAMGAAPQDTQHPLSDTYIESLRAEFPKLRIIHKAQSRSQQWVAAGVSIVTFSPRARYLDNYVTTLGQRIYLNRGWESRSDESRYIVLRHEAVHIRQFQRYGVVLMSLLYAIPIFPIGLAYGRARLEWEAYAETMRARAEVWGIESVKDERFRKHIVSQFTGSGYAWMWPFPKAVNRWFDTELSAIEEGSQTAPKAESKGV